MPLVWQKSQEHLCSDLGPVNVCGEPRAEGVARSASARPKGWASSQIDPIAGLKHQMARLRVSTEEYGCFVQLIKRRLFMKHD